MKNVKKLYEWPRPSKEKNIDKWFSSSRPSVAPKKNIQYEEMDIPELDHIPLYVIAIAQEMKNIYLIRYLNYLVE